MKTKIYLPLALLLLLAITSYAVSVPASLQGTHVCGNIEVAFSPNGGITKMIVSEIDHAGKSINVMAYNFTSDAIADALIAAEKRGVTVRIIADKSNDAERYKPFMTKISSTIPVKIDRTFRIAHNKVMIIDDKDIITGSFNFTGSAEINNGENCLIIHDNPALVTEYNNYFEWRWKSTTLYNAPDNVIAFPEKDASEAAADKQAG